MGDYLGRFDPLGREAESRTQMGGSFPEAFVSGLRMQDASLSRTDKSLVLAGAQENLGMAAVAGQMRRFLGPWVAQFDKMCWR